MAEKRDTKKQAIDGDLTEKEAQNAAKTEREAREQMDAESGAAPVEYPEPLGMDPGRSAIGNIGGHIGSHPQMPAERVEKETADPSENPEEKGSK